MEEGITVATNFAVLMRQRGTQKIDVVLAYITKKTAMAIVHRLNSSTGAKGWVYWATDDWDQEKYENSIPWPSTLDLGKLGIGTLDLGRVSDNVRRR